MMISHSCQIFVVVDVAVIGVQKPRYAFPYTLLVQIHIG